MTDTMPENMDDLDPFEAPPAAEFFNFGDHYDKKVKDHTAGALLIIKVLGKKEGISTVHGESDAISADIHVVKWEHADPDSDDSGNVYEGTMIFSKTLVPTLEKRIGSLVLCRLTTGEGKKGQNPPWRLSEVEKGTPDYTAALTYWKAYLASKQKDPFAA